MRGSRVCFLYIFHVNWLLSRGQFRVQRNLKFNEIKFLQNINCPIYERQLTLKCIENPTNRLTIEYQAAAALHYCQAILYLDGMLYATQQLMSSHRQITRNPNIQPGDDETDTSPHEHPTSPRPHATYTQHICVLFGIIYLIL